MSILKNKRSYCYLEPCQWANASKLHRLWSICSQISSLQWLIIWPPLHTWAEYSIVFNVWQALCNASLWNRH